MSKNYTDPASMIMAALLPLHTAATLDWLADAVCTGAETALGSTFTLLYLEGQDGTLERKLPASDIRRRSVQRGIDAFGETAFPPRLDPAGAPAVAEALESGAPIVGPASDAFRGLVDEPRASEAQQSLGASCAVLAPMDSSGERVGLLVMLAVRRPSAEHARLFAEHAACAAVNLRQSVAAREHGVIDVARSVFDARKIESELQKELARGVRYKRPVAIAVIEATNLRLLRERFGAFLTEQLLQRLGGALAEGARDIDVLGAYKESGYTMILTEATPEGVRIAAERLLAIAQRTRVAADDVPGLELHLACGWATSPADGTTTDALFAAAEARMYGSAERVA